MASEDIGFSNFFVSRRTSGVAPSSQNLVYLLPIHQASNMPFRSKPHSSFAFSSLLLRMGVSREVSISLDGVRDKNLMQLKKLNIALFPVRYNDKYYADALASGEFTKLAYYSDICVGAIACRLEKKEGGAIRVYIMTLGVLAPYRGLGIGTKLLNHVLDLCSKQNISEVYLHVQTNNDDAINFYKKFGFEITETIHNYYTNIEPPDCYVVTKQMAPSPTKK